ncbi:hypothetical protein [Arthrobacter wenxiniae]|uniref:Uncharacterized protein n=1 Tax=Arthrobacter wenxiniae TaxID=2713570 RepID=A0A7Y7IFX2_9MICC|nr:hypothetical protein [Arthrobacter wenxiniae]NVM94260.1 hypothetical protein [Arthrobacter wenxiniae]
MNGHQRGWLWVWGSAAALGACVAVAGLAVLLHVRLWPLVMLAAATSPWAVNRLLRLTAPHVPTPPAAATSVVSVSRPHLDMPVGADIFTAAVRTLDDGDLCRAWRGSYQSLEGAYSPAIHAYVVTLRQAYMDEMDRRDHAGLQAWLVSSPQPHGGPEKFLLHGDDDRR